MEEYRRERLEDLAVLIQKVWRGWHLINNYKKMKSAQITIAATWRAWKVISYHSLLHELFDNFIVYDKNIFLYHVFDLMLFYLNPNYDFSLIVILICVIFNSFPLLHNNIFEIFIFLLLFLKVDFLPLFSFSKKFNFE